MIERMYGKKATKVSTMATALKNSLVITIDHSHIQRLEVRDSFYTDNHRTVWIYTRDDKALNQRPDTDSFEYQSICIQKVICIERIFCY